MTLNPAMRPIVAIVALNVGIIVLTTLYTIYKNKKLDRRRWNVDLFPDLTKLSRSGSRFMVYYGVLLTYIGLLSAISYFSVNYIHTYQLPGMLSAAIFGLLILTALGGTYVLIRLVFPEGYIQVKKLVMAIRHKIGHSDKKNLEDALVLRNRLQFLDSEEVMVEPLQYSTWSNKMTTERAYQVYALQNNLHGSGKFQINRNEIQKKLEKEQKEKNKEQKKTTKKKEKKSRDSLYPFYYVLTFIPHILNIAVIIFMGVLISNDENAENAFQFFFTALLRLLILFLAILIDYRKIDKYMRDRQYHEAIYYNLFMTVFHAFYLLFGILRMDIIPLDFSLFGAVFIIYLIKFLICVYRINQKESKEPFKMNAVLRQVDLSQYMIMASAFIFLERILVWVVLDFEESAVTIEDVIGTVVVLVLIGILIFGFFIFEIIFYFTITRYVQNDKPTKAKVGNVIFLLSAVGLIPTAQSSEIGAAGVGISTISLIFTLIFSLPPFIDRVLEIFRKRKLSYYKEHYRAEEKTVFAVQQEFEEKIEDESINPSSSIASKAAPLEIKLKEDVKNLKKVQRLLQGLPEKAEESDKINSKQGDSAQHDAKSKELTPLLKYLPKITFSLALVIVVVLIWAYMDPTPFIRYYTESPFGALGNSAKDVYLRRIKVLIYASRILLSTIVFYIFDVVIIGNAVKKGQGHRVLKLQNILTFAQILYAVDLVLFMFQDPFILLLNAKILIIFLSVLGLIKQLAMKEFYFKNHANPKPPSYQDNLMQTNVSRTIIGFMLILVLYSEYWAIFISTPIIETASSLTWTLGIQIGWNYVLGLLVMVLIGLFIELAYFATVTIHLSRDEPDKISRMALSILSICTIPYFAQGIFGFIILYKINNENVVEEREEKKFEKKLRTYREMKGGVSSRSIKSSVPMKNGVKELNENKRIDPASLNPHDAIKEHAQKRNGKTLKYWIPTPLLVAIFGDPVFRKANIKSNDKTSVKTSVKNRQLHDSREAANSHGTKDATNKVTKHDRQNLLSGSKLDSNRREKTANEIQSVKDEIDQTIRQKDRKSTKERIKGAVATLRNFFTIGETHQVDRKASEPEVTDKKVVDGNSNSADGNKTKNQDGSQSKRLPYNDSKSRLNKEQNALKSNLRKITTQNISNMFLLIAAIMVLYIIGLFATAHDPDSVLWFHPSIIILIVGIIGIIFKKKALYGLIAVSLIPALLMVVLDFINGDFLTFTINLSLTLLAILILGKFELPAWDSLLIASLVYLYMAIVSHVTLLGELMQRYLDTMGPIFFVFMLIGPFFAVFYSYINNPGQKALKFKTRAISDGKPTRVEKFIYERRGETPITVNLGFIAFFIIGLILTVTVAFIAHNLWMLFSLPLWISAAVIVVIFFRCPILSSLIVALLPSFVILSVAYLYPVSFTAVCSVFILIAGLFIIIKRQDAKYEYVMLFGLVFSLFSVGLSPIILNFAGTVQNLIVITLIDTVMITTLIYVHHQLKNNEIKKELERRRREKAGIQEAVESDNIEYVSSIDVIDDLDGFQKEYNTLRKKLLNSSSRNISAVMDTFLQWMKGKEICISEGGYTWLQEQPVYKTRVKPLGIEKYLTIVPVRKMDLGIFMDLYGSFYNSPQSLEAAKSIAMASGVDCDRIVLPDTSWLFLEDLCSDGSNSEDSESHTKLSEKNPSFIRRISLSISNKSPDPPKIDYCFKFTILPFSIPKLNYAAYYKAQNAKDEIKRIKETISRLRLKGLSDIGGGDTDIDAENENLTDSSAENVIDSSADNVLDPVGRQVKVNAVFRSPSSSRFRLIIVQTLLITATLFIFYYYLQRLDVISVAEIEIFEGSPDLNTAFNIMLQILIFIFLIGAGIGISNMLNVSISDTTKKNHGVPAAGINSAVKAPEPGNELRQGKIKGLKGSNAEEIAGTLEKTDSDSKASNGSSKSKVNLKKSQ